MAKYFYQSCMDMAKIEEVSDRPLREVIARLGGWPVVNKASHSLVMTESNVTVVLMDCRTGQRRRLLRWSGYWAPLRGTSPLASWWRSG